MASPKYKLAVTDLRPTKTNAAVAGVGSFVALLVMLIGKLWPDAWANDAERALWEMGLMFAISYVASVAGKFSADTTSGGGGDQKKSEHQ